MANTNAPFGFRLLGLTGGSASATFGMTTAKIASNDTTACFQNDPVKMLNTGYVSQWTNNTVVSQLAGIFVGCKYYNTAFKRVVWSNYWPGSGATGDVTVYLNPGINTPAGLFVVQAAATEVTFADIGKTVDVTVGSGSTLTGISAATLENNVYNGAATDPFRIVDIWSNFGAPGSSGTDASAYNWVVVTANVAQATGTA
jgi:hypothetical protein